MALPRTAPGTPAGGDLDLGPDAIALLTGFNARERGVEAWVPLSRLRVAKWVTDLGGLVSIGQVDSTDFETMLAKLLEGAVVEIRELDPLWSGDLETRRIINNMRLAFILECAREPGAKAPSATHCAIVTLDQARTLLAAGATWFGSAEADPLTQ